MGRLRAFGSSLHVEKTPVGGETGLDFHAALHAIRTGGRPLVLGFAPPAPPSWGAFMKGGGPAPKKGGPPPKKGGGPAPKKGGPAPKKGGALVVHENLGEAACGGDLRAVTRLLKDGADPNDTSHLVDGTRSPLYVAAAFGHLDVVDVLLRAGADTEFKHPHSGKTPLCEALVYNFTDTAQRLLQAGADVNVTTKDGRTPLIQAVMSVRVDERVKMLVHAGADPTVRSQKWGGTALEIAQAKGECNSETLELLQQHTLLHQFSTQSLGKPPTGAAPRAGGGGGGGAAADAEPEPAAQPLPPVPPSPMSGRTLASSNFRVAYAKTKAPDSLMKLGAKLGDLIKTYCIAHSIPYDDDEG